MIMPFKNEDFHGPLILTDKDEMFVATLWVKDSCPFWVRESNRKLKLQNTQKVFYREEGNQWAFSLRKG